jgi:uncharacterized protein (TIGR02145 family)
MKKILSRLLLILVFILNFTSCRNSEKKENDDEVADYNELGTEVKIGNQIWMTKNLNVDKFRNGDPIPEARTDEEWKKAGEMKQPAWCYYNNDPKNAEKVGKLYNWYAVNDSRGLSPKGWHIPTNSEFNILENYLGDEPGKKMKSTNFWNEVVTNTNSSGFSGLPGGFREDKFSLGFDPSTGVGVWGIWWTLTEFSTENDPNVALTRSLLSNEFIIGKSSEKFEKGISVRCIKDEKCLTKIIDDSIEISSINNQIWMTKNLNVDKFRNGDPIPQARTDEEWKKAGEMRKPAWCYYNNDSNNGKKYGRLYNWYAINDARGLAPKGWHIPSNIEWIKMIEFLGGEEIAGEKMNSMYGWNDKGNGSNISGFTGLPGGYRFDNGGFVDVGSFGYWWSLEGNKTGLAWHKSLIRLSREDLNDYGRIGFLKEGLSVRCIKD